MTTEWRSNTPISMPAPSKDGIPVHVDFGGFCFTANGMSHNISATDIETYLQPIILPDLKPENDE